MYFVHFFSLSDDCQLLTVLTNGATGRNPTFFKAYGHEDVFGLKACIPEGGTTLEVSEDVPSEDGLGQASEENVLYVRLPEGHPVITAEERPEPPPLPTSSSNSNSSVPFNMEEAIVQAELIFEDDAAGMDMGLNSEDHEDAELASNENQIDDQDNVDETSKFDPCFIVPDLEDDITFKDKSENIPNKDKTDDMVEVSVDVTDSNAKELPSPGKRTSPRTSTKKSSAESVLSVFCDAVKSDRPSRSVKQNSLEPILIDLSDEGSNAETSPKVKILKKYLEIDLKNHNLTSF